MSLTSRLRDKIDELRRSFEPKENAIETLQQSLMEKDQMLEDMKGLLQAAEEKRQASIAELSAKHQKTVESLEAQLADAVSERTKATETISSLQVLIAEKESKIAEMDAASSGEAARLRAAMETIKGELVHLKHEHVELFRLKLNHIAVILQKEKEKESWEAASQALKTKLEFAESNCIRAEIEAAKIRSQLELELSVQTQLLSTRDAELMASKEEVFSFFSHLIFDPCQERRRVETYCIVKDGEPFRKGWKILSDKLRNLGVSLAVWKVEESFASYRKMLVHSEGGERKENLIADAVSFGSTEQWNVVWIEIEKELFDKNEEDLKRILVRRLRGGWRGGGSFLIRPRTSLL
ncbi:Protein GRIP [Vitis vinifera]|uniref:Protein GRIP n=1 Tax=Vitis vinifera TaxID=29760 RepID=A0A438HMN6_VITVI|nr:Protein GRIP [Vitis vinifera]